MLAFSKQWHEVDRTCALAAGGDGRQCDRAYREKRGCEELAPHPYPIGPLKELRRCPTRIILDHADAVAQAQAVAMLGDELRWACPDPTVRTIECWQAIQTSRGWDWDLEREKSEREAERRRAAAARASGRGLR